MSISRRQLLAAAAGVAVSAPLRSLLADSTNARVASLVLATIGIDAHNHIDVPTVAADVPGPDLDVAGELRRSGLSAVCATFAVDYQPLTQPGMAYDRFVNAMASLDAQLARNKMRRALSLPDLRAAHDQHMPTVVQGVEGCHFLEGKLERVEVAYKRGVRVLGLVHDSDASVPLGDLYTAPAHLGGLTAFGASVIKEANRLGILLDLTHASVDTVKAALKASTTPVVFSHTGLDTRLGRNPSLGEMMRPRLISKEHAKTIAAAGGVIGVWTHLVDSAAEYVQAVRELVGVVGIDHVCIGTDTKLTPDNRPGGRPRAGGRTNEAWASEKVGFYFAVVGEMVKQGFNNEEIGKVGGGNFCRVFDAATARPR